MTQTKPRPISLRTYNLFGCYIAGGALLSHYTKQPIADFDVYPKTFEALEDAVYELCENGHIINVSSRSITIKTNDMNLLGHRLIYQIIILDDIETTRATIETIFENFDFTVCCVGLDCDTNEIHTHPKFWEDVASKTLRFTGATRFPLASLVRTIKYQKKGYTMPKSEMIRLAVHAGETYAPIKTWEEAEEVIGGFYGKRLKLDVDVIEFTTENLLDRLSTLGDEEIVYPDYKDVSPNQAIIDVSTKKYRYLQFMGSSIYVTEDNHVHLGKDVSFDDKNPRFTELGKDDSFTAWIACKKSDGASNICGMRSAPVSCGESVVTKSPACLYLSPAQASSCSQIYGWSISEYEIYKVYVKLSDVVSASNMNVRAKVFEVSEEPPTSIEESRKSTETSTLTQKD